MYKFIFCCVCLFLYISGPAMAASAVLGCGTNQKMIQLDDEIVRLTNDTCATSGFGAASACLSNSYTDGCFLYAPADTSLTDTSGTYLYEDYICIYE